MREVALVSRKSAVGSRRGDATGRTPRYWAFLSYSHKDSDTADWLHGALERYRVPRTLVGRETATGTIPASFSPVFRDRHELAASGDLGHNIREALGASRCLIVLCSPEAARSRWTNEEVLAFRKLHPQGRLLAAITGGEPFASDMPGREAEECFPPALRQKFDSRGRPTGKRAEPIAADLRADKDGRQLGLLKIVAGMIGVGLDDLVQREQQRRQKRLTYIAAASLAGMTVTSGLAVFAFDKRDEARDQRREAEGLVGFMLGDLRERLEPIGRLDALDAVGGRALQYFEKQDKSELSDEALTQRSKALTLMGEIANTRGDLSRALRLYQEAFASTAESVRRYPNDAQRLFDHAQNVFYVGQIAYQRGALKQAESAWREYKNLADRMVSLDAGNNDYRLEQVYSNNSLGSVLVDLRRYGEAAAIYQSSLAIAETLAAAEPAKRDYQFRVSNALAWLADAHEYSGALEGALAERERQLRLLSEMQRRDPRDTQIQRYMMTAHRSIGRLLASGGDIAGGLRESLLGVAISDELNRIEPQNTEWLQANAAGRFDLADLQLSSGDIAGAASTTRAACDIVDRLVRLDSSVADWQSRFRVNCLSLRSRIASAQGDGAGALALARETRAAAIASTKPLDKAMLGVLAASVGSAALAGLGRREEAAAWASDALRAMPANLGLKPREMVEVAALNLQIGDSKRTRALASRLQSMGYRHPAFARSVVARAAA
jgi:tetratricopeptide (TPR) repeat protein